MSTVTPARAGRQVPRRRTAVVAGVGLLLLGGAGVGYAAWSSTANGSSQARSTSAVDLTVTAATGTADLYPGGTGAVYFTVENPNPYPVHLTAADFATVTSDSEATCPASNITVNDQAVNITVPAKTTTVTQSVAGAVGMVTAAPDGCQARTFTIATTLTGQSA